MRIRCGIVLLLLTTVLGCSDGKPKGGGPLDPLGFFNLTESLDRAVNKFSERFEDTNQQLREYKTTLKELEKSFSEHNKELAEQFKHIGDHVVSHTSAEARADIDYLQTNIKDNLKQISEALKEAREEMEKEKSDEQRKAILSKFLSDVAKKVWLDPTIVSFTPHQVELHWPEPGSTAYTIRLPDNTTVLAHGWGFDLPGGSAVQPKIRVESQDGKKRDVSATVSRSTNYLFQVTLDPSSPQLKHGDRKLIVVTGSRERELPIVHKVGPAPVTITAIILTVHTPGSAFSDHNDKDREIYYTYSIEDAQGKSVGAIHNVGKGDEWPDRGREGTTNEFRIPINAGALKLRDRNSYCLHVVYHSTKGDPDHWCRFSAKAVLSDGTDPKQVLSWTANVQFGHHKNHPERINRFFPLNQ